MKPIKFECTVFLNLLKFLDKFSYPQARELLANKIMLPLSARNEVLFPEEAPAQLAVEKPFLPPIEAKYSYTLVLDLDETLIHYVEEED
jgi:hypothetical protein